MRTLAVCSWSLRPESPDLLADALGRLWPSPDHHSLHPVVSVLTTTFTLGSALAVFVLARRPTDALGSAGLLGALTVTMTLAPAIVWDDHLTFLALPIVVAGTGLWSGRLGRRWRIPLILAYAVLAVPPEWLLPVGWWFPDLARPALDAKTWSALLFGAAGIVIARS